MTDILMHERELRAEFGITRVGDVTRLRLMRFPRVHRHGTALARRPQRLCGSRGDKS